LDSESERKDTGERRISPATSFGCARAITSHAEGYTPDWPGMEDYKGEIVHPQTWPKDID
jgi:hypothetical protein